MTMEIVADKNAEEVVNKDAKVTVCEQRRNPDPSTRVKRRTELILLLLDLEKRTLKVIQQKVGF